MAPALTPLAGSAPDRIPAANRGVSGPEHDGVMINMMQKTCTGRGWRTVATFAALVVLIAGVATVTEPAVPRNTPFVRCVSPRALAGDLHSNPQKQLVAQMMVSTAEYSSLYWEDQVVSLHYNVEDSDQWNRGYTGGIIGFTSKTASMAELVRRYAATRPQGNPLAPFLPALEALNGTSSAACLCQDFERALK